MQCPDGGSCAFLQGALRYEESPENILHLQTYVHPRADCRYGAECKSFRRIEAGGERPYDIMHLLTFRHPPRLGRPMAVTSAAFQTVVGYHGPAVSRHDHERPDEYHTGWAGKEPSLNDLTSEFVREGFGQELRIQGESQFKTLQEKALSLVRHPRNTKRASAAEILAVMVYTGTEVYSAYNADKRGFYSRDKSVRMTSRPRFPVLDRLLLMAKGSLPVPLPPFDEPEDPENFNPWSPDLNLEKHIYLWCGMHRVYLSLADRKAGRFRLAQEQSMSRSREVADSFMSGEGTVFRCQVGYYSEHAAMRMYEETAALYMADLSWISKFPDEEEVLVEAGVELCVTEIRVLSADPLVEMVECRLCSTFYCMHN